MMYFETKLMEKVNHRLKMSGEDPFDLDFFIKICKNVTLGRYHVGWMVNGGIMLKRLDDNYKVIQEAGKYTVMDGNRLVVELFSSEYIRFEKKELRDFNLNVLLN